MTETKSTPNARFAADLIALGQHLLLQPDLPAIANIKQDYFMQPGGFQNGLDIQLGNVNGLAAWAGTLTDVTSHVQRLESGSVHAFVFGLMGEVRVRVWSGPMDGAAIPQEPGAHEWDVTAQLREA